MQERYNFAEIEPKWQAWWDERGQYEVHDAGDAPMAYVLEQFPYPSGDRLHMGHARVYSLGDALARYLTMKGFRVLHPMGWDAFGLPAENAAIKRHVHPAQWTEENIAYMRDHQMRKLGYSYDWKREVTTCRPDYYHWTQWLFLEFYKGGKAYRKAAAVNWCPGCDTVLANEQVHDGKCWRCDSEVTKKNLTQWFLKITDYAEQLLEGLDELPQWPDKVKAIQRHWIGKSQGAEIDFPLAADENVTVFTTRPDTLLGVTYVVLAPEHPLVERLAGSDPTVAAFREEVARLTEIERTSTERPKGGVPIGAHLTHPLTGEEIPIWTADYVLLEYGTGAVMGVPAHDERDYVFAKSHGLPIKPVIRPKAGEWLEDAAFTEAGIMVHSPGYDGLESEAAKRQIVQDLEAKGLGRSRVTYRLRDWLVSRQRYWGAPIPMIHCDRCGAVPVPDDQLPVVLPDNVQFSGKGQSPLASVADFINTACPTCQGAARRDTDTMDTFMCSSWYYLRYPDPHNTRLPFDKVKADAWLPVDEYVGGMEHAAMHLLYSRFFTRYLCDRGRLSFKEPFTSLLTQGTITRGGLRMSKSKGNVVSPDELMREYGADTIRVYILFAAPPEKDLEWSDAGVEGAYRFLQRVWRQARQILDGAGAETAAGNELHVLTHKTIQNVSRDYEERAFNTVVSGLMILSNGIQDALLGTLAPAGVLREALEALVLMLAPIAPHVSEELWHQLGHATSVHRSNWPTFDPKALVTDEVEIAVQINGKVRDRLKVPTGASKEEIKALVLASDAVQSQLDGKHVHDVIVVPNRLANVVVK